MDPITRFSHATKHVVKFSGLPQDVLIALENNQKNLENELLQKSRAVFGHDMSVDLFVGSNAQHPKFVNQGIVELRATGPESRIDYLQGYFRSVLFALQKKLNSNLGIDN